MKGPLLVRRMIPEWTNPATWWDYSFGFQGRVAFLLGMPVGFLFRPLQTPDTLQGSIPPFLSLWGFWLVPVILLGGIMWIKILAVLRQRSERLFFWQGARAHIGLLCGLFLLVCGIAPSELLQQLHLSLDPSGLFDKVLNPCAVGLVIAFIFEDVSRPFAISRRAILLGGVAWAGTVTLFLILLSFYSQIIPQNPPLGHCIGFCSSNPVPLLFNTSLIWISIGLLLSWLGGFIGVLLCHLSLAQQKQ